MTENSRRRGVFAGRFVVNIPANEIQTTEPRSNVFYGVTVTVLAHLR